MRFRRQSLFEPLESRTLLSASAFLPALAAGGPLHSPPLSAAPAAAAPVTAAGIGDTLHLTAGVPFTGEVAFYPSPVLDPPDAYSASINWGDGSAGQATLQYGMHGTVGGYEIIGTHTYADPGNYTTVTTVSIGPIITPGQPPIEMPTQLVARIIGQAIVQPANSAGGVTINEIAGRQFTADVGSFVTIAPGMGLKAMINWGDGKQSAGTLVPSGVVGLDEVQYNVVGTHTYADPGTFAIHIVVTKPSSGPSTTAIPVIATIDSTAVVTAPAKISLAGTISGTYTILATPAAPTTAAGGRTYQFDGTGSAGDLGAVTAAATVTLPGLAAGSATGTLTLSNANGSVTLRLAGPVPAAVSAVGSFPSTLAYEITQATGAYAGSEDSGTIAVTLAPAKSATAALTFRFVIS